MGIGLAAVLVLFVLVVFVLPTPVARYVINSQLDSLGIQHDGIDTVDIDLWNSKVRAGPVTFRSGEAQDGQLGETGFDYSFGELFKGRAFVQTFYLRGVDVHVTRLENGTIEINGVNLQDLAASDQETAAKAQPEAEKEGPAFGFGGESFEFSDSKLVFEDLSGGTLTMDLDRLTLHRLRSWTPDEPTSFELRGRLNEMELSLDGTVVPLGDPLRLTLNSRVTGITLDRIARFVGPTGLSQQDGTIDTEVHYDYVINRDGRVEGTVDGTYHLKAFDIATPSGETATLDKADLKVDLRQTLQPDGSATAAGQLNLTGAGFSLSTAAGDALKLGSIDLALGKLDLKKGAEQRRRLIEAAAATGQDTGASKAVPSIVQLLIGWARDLGEDALRHQLSLDGEPSLALKDGMIRVAARGEVPRQEIGFDEVTVNLRDVVSRAFDAGWSGSGALDTVVSGLRVALQDGRAVAGLSEFRIGSKAIKVNVTQDQAAIALDLSAGLRDLTAKVDQGGAVNLQRLSLTTENYKIGQTADSEEAGGSVSVSLEGLAATLPGDAGALALRGDALNLKLSPFTLTGKQGEAVQLVGSLEAQGLSLERGGQSPLSVSLESTRSDLQDIRIAPLSAQAVVEGGLATTLSNLRFETGQGAQAVALSLESLENQVEGLRASGFDGGAPSATLSNRTKLSTLTARLPFAGGETAEATVGALDAPLTELAYSEGALRAKGDVEVTGIAAQSAGEHPQSLELDSLSVTGLDGDSASGAAVERIALGKLNAKLALPLPGPTAAPSSGGSDGGGADAEADAADAQSGAGTAAPRFDKQFKLGEFSLTPGSTIEITDAGVEPPLQATVVLDELKAGPLDTAAPESRTDLTLALSVNDASKARVQGWAAPLKAKPDFEVTSNVDGLPLPILSSYAAKVTGVNIESGELFSDVEAKAAEGKLGGEIGLRINDLFVTPLSEEEAKKLQADIGLPVGFAVSILKDSKGVIAFGLPLGGTVDAPEVDYSEAISKAISGAMASVFPTSWFGPDGNSFEMKPAPFVAGSTELTEDGKAVADQMGGLFASKPGISIRACGRSGRADLVALRGGPVEAPGDTAAAAGTLPPDTPPADAADAAPPANDAASAALEPPPDKGIAPPAEAAIAPPSDEEVKALLALATERGAAVRKYLAARYGIDPKQIPECRTTYSIEDGKPPRAEFQF